MHTVSEAQKFSYNNTYCQKMNVTLSVAFGRPPIQLPSQSIVDINLAVTVVFTTVSPIFNGMLFLVMLFSKELRSQPYQWLLANYLLSTIALMFGFGIYRIFQIQNYRYDGFMKSSEESNCGVARFFEFPLLTSNICLFLLGCERYVLLKDNKAVNRFVLFLFLALPWTLGIYCYIFELVASKERYLNIPYVGLCIDISSERESRRNLYVVLNVAVPLSLALTSITLAYYKCYVVYKNTTMYLRRRSFGNADEEAFLLHRKKFVRKVFRSINIAAILLGIRVAITTITSSLFSQFSEDDLSQDYRNRVGTIGVVIIYLETIIIPTVYLIYNHTIQKALINSLLKLIPRYRRAVIS